METPKENWGKLNFDGVARNEGSTGGGMVRDSEGIMLLDYVSNLGRVSNNVVEAMELFWGLKLIINVGWESVKIDGDPNIIIETVKDNIKEGWAIKRVIEDNKAFITHPEKI